MAKPSKAPEPAIDIDLVVERMPIDALRPYSRNSRDHSEEQIDEIVASLKEFGWTNPMLVDEDGTIIAGHARLEAALRLGLEEAPVIVARGWSDEQKRKYVIADNRLAEKAHWNLDMLAIELADLGLRDADDASLQSIGFTSAELDELLIGIDPADLDISEADDEIPEPAEEAVSQPGDLWLLGDHRLICGDATDSKTVDRLLAGAKPNLMIADPPYGVAYDPAWRAEVGINKSKNKMGKVQNDDRADWRDAWALFPGDVAYVWHAGLQASLVEESLRATGFELRSQIVWAKDRFALSRSDYHWKHEPCWYAIRAGATANWNGDRSQSTVWEIPARDDAGHGHGTQKPIACMLRPMLNNSAPGDAVYDPFCGSGTTIIAAERAGRRCYAIELDPIYVDVIVRRWQAFTGGAATLDGDGRTFDTVAAERLPTPHHETISA